MKGFRFHLLVVVGILVGLYGLRPPTAGATAAKPSASKESRLQAQTIASLAELHEWVRARQGHWLEITPPSEEFILTQDETLLPFAWDSFPHDFRQGLRANPRDALWGYSVVVREDPATHDLVFSDADGADVFRLPPPPGYDPLDVLTPALLARRETLADAALAEFDRAYRADRIRLKVRLLPDTLIPAYCEAERRLEAEQKEAAKTATPDLMLMRTLAPGEFGFEQLSASSAGVELSVRMPASFSGSLDIYSIENLMTFPWTLETNLTASAGASVGLSLAASGPTRFYHAADAGVDSDGDSLPDARETRLVGTDPTEPDTDGDSLPDGWEALYGLHPAAYSATELLSDSDGDGFGAAEEYLRGTSPLAGDEPAPTGTVSTVRYYYDDDDRLLATFLGSSGLSRETRSSSHNLLRSGTEAP